MSKLFFEETKPLKEKIRKEILKSFSKISNEKIRKILIQRANTSSFLKGILADYVHRGLGGKFNQKDRLRLISGLEIYAGGLVLMDNLLDGHNIRNNETTYLFEFGSEMQALASQYSTHLGMFRMIPYLENVIDFSSRFRYFDQVFSGAINMDVEKPKNSTEVLNSISKVNGYTLGLPLALIATTATRNMLKIWNVFRYGYNSGISFGIYEEIRDLMGEHGRGRGYELERGRIPLVMFLASEKDKSFNPQDYTERVLSEKEFISLYNKLREIGVFDDIENKVDNYFLKSKRNLEKAVDSRCAEKLDLLRRDITDSLHQYFTR